MIKAILFDFWGTLAENGVKSPIKQVKNILNIDLPFSSYVVRMEKAMMASKFDSLNKAFESVFEEFGIEKSESKMQELIGMWNKSWMLADVYEDTIKTLKDLKDENFKIILISNTDMFSINNVLDKFEMRNLFDKMYFSYEMGLIKTDKKFLETVLADLGLNNDDCVLIGDSLASDIKAAQNQGIKAILVDRNNRRDYSPKINKLSDLKDKL
jgi:putative hydrolase of the HAD superfamily